MKRLRIAIVALLFSAIPAAYCLEPNMAVSAWCLSPTGWRPLAVDLGSTSFTPNVPVKLYGQGPTGWGPLLCDSNGYLILSTINSSAPQQQIGGSSSGNAVFSQPFQGASYKKVVIQLNALVGTASYTFPTPFSLTPDYFIGGRATGATISTISTTAVTITGITSTGLIVLEGY